MKPLEILENDTKSAFVQILCNMSVMKETALDVKRAKEFVCRLYGLSREIKSVDDARYAKLCQMTGKINARRNISKISKKITLLLTCFGLNGNLTANIFLH